MKDLCNYRVIVLCVYMFAILIIGISCKEKYKPINDGKFYSGHVALHATSVNSTGFVVLNSGENNLAYGAIYKYNRDRIFSLDDPVNVSLQSFDGHTFVKEIKKYDPDLEVDDFDNVDQYLSINFHNATDHGGKKWHVAGHIQFEKMNGRNYLEIVEINGQEYYMFLYSNDGVDRVDTLYSITEPPKKDIAYWLEINENDKIVKEFPTEHKHIGHQLKEDN